MPLFDMYLNYVFLVRWIAEQPYNKETEEMPNVYQSTQASSTMPGFSSAYSVLVWPFLILFIEELADSRLTNGFLVHMTSDFLFWEAILFNLND